MVNKASRTDSAYQRQKLKAEWFNAVLILSFLVYPGASIVIIRTFHCIDFEDGYGNRPDDEVEPPLQSAALEEAVRAAGMNFVYIPVTNEGLTLDQVQEQAEQIAGADGPVLAYCRSGTRSSIVWAMGKAGEMPVDEILATTSKAGYQLDGLRPSLESLAAQKS